MKNVVRKLFAFSLASSMILSLGACGKPSGGGNQTEGTKAPEKTTEAGKETAANNTTASDGEKVKLVFLRAGTEDYKKEAFTQIIAAFEKEYPNYTVEYQEAPWGNDFETKLNTGYASGTAPDVIHYSLASIGARVPMGQYECLNDYVKDWEGIDDLYDSVKQAGSIGDDLYGIAYTPDARVFAINTELFEQAGLDPENPPTNWDELLEAHKKLLVKDAGGNITQCGFSLPINGTNINQYLEIFAAQNGIQNLVNESTNEILFNKPEAVEAMDYLKELCDVGIIEWNNSQNDQNPFYSGKAGMTIISENEFNNINTGDLEGKIKMVPMFGQKDKATFCGMHFMFMNADSKKKEAAWDLIQFMCSKESMEIWMRTAKTAPVRQSLEAVYLEMNGVNGPMILDSISIGRGAPKVPYFNTIFNDVDDAMEQVLYGQSTSQEALDEAAEKVQEEIDNQ